MCISMEFNFNAFFGKKSFTSRIFGSEMKNQLFGRKMCVLCSFYQIKVQAISYWSCRLKKHQTLEIWLLSAFVRTSLKSQCPRFFRFFVKSSLAHAKIIVCLLFHLKKVDITQQNLMSQFCDNYISRLSCTSGFKCGNLTIDFTANSTSFKNSKNAH